MAHDDEKNSSFSRENSSFSLISFVGFQEHLVLNFVKTFIDDSIEVILFSSVFDRIIDEDKKQKNFEIRKKTIQLIRNTAGDDISVILIELENIWDFQEYYVRLSRRNIEKAIINISAGPAVFSAAGMIWAIENGHNVSYSVEYHDGGKLISSVFNKLDLRPYINSIFSTDNVDKMILTSLRNGKSDTIQVLDYLNDFMGYRISLRSIEIHLEKLNKLGIVDITKGRVNKVSLSQNWTKIGFSFRKR